MVESYIPAPFADPGGPSRDPARSLGPPDGRTLALGRGAHITIRFFRPLRDGPGPDLRVYEVGPDGAEAWVAASDDGLSFFEFSTVASGATTELDLAASGLPHAAFVRIRGADDAGLEEGFDLDAVEALH